MDIEIIAKVDKVSERIQKLRHGRCMSQMDLAIEAGISQGFLAMIETRRKVPTIMTIFKLAKALKERNYRYYPKATVIARQTGILFKRLEKAESKRIRAKFLCYGTYYTHCCP